MSDNKVDLDVLYRAEGWGDLAEAALKIRPQDVESAAREVARYASKVIDSLRTERDGLRIKLDEANSRWESEKSYKWAALKTGKEIGAKEEREAILSKLDEAHSFCIELSEELRKRGKQARASEEENSARRIDGVRNVIRSRAKGEEEGSEKEYLPPFGSVPSGPYTPSNVHNQHKRKPEGYVTLGELADMSMRPNNDPR